MVSQSKERKGEVGIRKLVPTLARIPGSAPVAHTSNNPVLCEPGVIEADICDITFTRSHPSAWCRIHSELTSLHIIDNAFNRETVATLLENSDHNQHDSIIVHTSIVIQLTTSQAEVQQYKKLESLPLNLICTIT